MPRWVWCVLICALTAHLWAAFSVAAQPLRVDRAAPEQRALTWELHHDAVRRIGPAADFFAVYHAGHSLAHDRTPYDLSETPWRTPYFCLFRYLPVVGDTLGRAALLLPEPIHAWRAWLVILEALLAVVLIRLWRRLRARPVWAAACVGLGLLSTPYLLELHMGQFTFATVALVWLAISRPHPSASRTPPQTRSRAALRTARAALAYAAAALLKLFPLAALPALLRSPRLRPVAALAVALVLVVGLVDFIPNPDLWSAFRKLNFSAPIGGLDAGNYGMAYLIRITAEEAGVQWDDTTWPRFMTLWRNLPLGLTALVVASTRARNVVIMACAMLLAHFVGYVHVWEHHASAIVLIGLAMLAATLPRDAPSPKLPAWWPFAVWIATAALVAPTPFALIEAAHANAPPGTPWSFGARAGLVASKALPTLALYLAAVYALARAGFQAPWRAFWSPRKPRS